MTLILASKSPRRIEMLQLLGFRFLAVPPDIDESIRQGETPAEYVLRLSYEKALRVSQQEHRQPVWILAADTVVVLDGEILGKPVSALDASRMLSKLSGKAHYVMTGYCVLQGGCTVLLHDVEKTQITFRSISPAEIQSDINSGEPLDKAGAYAIQGRGNRYITRVDGLISNVIGLPMERIAPVLSSSLVSDSNV